MQFTKRKHVLGIPVGPRRPNWSAIGAAGGMGIAGVSALTGTVAKIRSGASHAQDGSSESSSEENQAHGDEGSDSQQESSDSGEEQDEESQGEEDQGEEGSGQQSGEDQGQEEQGEQGESQDGQATSGGRSRHETSLKHIIQEQVDVAVPLKTAYNQWTQFAELPSETKGVKSVGQDRDDLTTWVVKVGPKKAEWKAKIVEQIPDERIAWQSKEGPENRGVVTFHRLSGNLTRIQIDMEFVPHGPLERVGALLGSPSRQVRHDLERFRHDLELSGQETGAWRGEIHSEDELSTGSGSNGHSSNGHSSQGRASAQDQGESPSQGEEESGEEASGEENTDSTEQDQDNEELEQQNSDEESEAADSSEGSEEEESEE